MTISRAAFGFLAAVLLLWGTAMTPALAQKGDGAKLQELVACYPDCPETPFDGIFRMTLSIPVTSKTNCVVLVEYLTRSVYCNKVWSYDLQIIRIKPLNDSCRVFDVSTMVHVVVNEMLVKNPMNFPPHKPGGCETNWRVSRGSCWGWTNEMIVPCPNASCCISRYIVCLNEAGERVITYNGNIEPPTCPPIVLDMQCSPVCGE